MSEWYLPIAAGIFVLLNVSYCVGVQVGRRKEFKEYLEQLIAVDKGES